MKQSQRDLLTNLRGRTINRSEEFLGNIKQSLGALRHVAGNPLTKNEIAVSIDIRYADTNLHVLLPPAALPAGCLNSTLPAYMFGLSDMYGNYTKTRSIVKLDTVNWNFASSGFWNYNFTGAVDAVIQLNLDLRDGDYLLVYTSAAVATVQAVIRIRCQNIAYATLVHSLMSDIIFLNTIRYVVRIADILQFTHPLFISHLSTFGNLSIDSLDPRMYVTNIMPQQQIADIPVSIPIDKSIAISLQINPTCQRLDFLMFVNKVEVLTKRT
jgi:hypothetical protein